MQLAFLNADGKPYEAANLLRRVLHPALERCGLQKTGCRVFRRSVATMLSAWTLVSAYNAGVLHTVGARVSKECDLQTRSNNVPKCA